MTKYYIEIQSTPHEAFGPRVGWDSLYESRREGGDGVRRAAAKFHGARIATIEAPSHVDHLYRQLTCQDTTSLYA